MNSKYVSRNIFLGCIALFVNCCAFAEEPVHFACPKFKTLIEQRLYKKNPTPTDMLELKELHAGLSPMTSIEGIEHALNLELLSLNGNEISDISYLSSLIRLKDLNLRGIEATDFSVLVKLKNLEILSLECDDIESISMLSELKNLKSLYLNWNNIEDISALKEMKNLESLHLQENAVKDISALTELHDLTRLNLRYNPLNEESIKVCVPTIRKNNPKLKKFDIYPHGTTRYWKRTVSGVVLAYLFTSLVMPILLVWCVIARRKRPVRDVVNNNKYGLFKKLFKQVDVIMAIILLLYLLTDVFFPKVNYLNFFLSIEFRVFETYLLDSKLPEELKNAGMVVNCIYKLIDYEGILGSILRTCWLAGQIGWVFVPLFLFKKSKSWFLKFSAITVWALVNVWHLIYYVFYGFLLLAFSFGGGWDRLRCPYGAKIIREINTQGVALG